MYPFEANVQFIRGNGELIPLLECKGRIALEGVLCYPPGIIYTTWGKMQKNAQNYYEQKEEGKERIYVIVLKRNLKLNYNVLKCFKNLNIFISYKNEW